MKSDSLIIAKAAFAEIAKQFPNLSMFENTEDLVELSNTLPIQSGLKYKILLLSLVPMLCVGMRRVVRFCEYSNEPV